VFQPGTGRTYAEETVSGGGSGVGEEPPSARGPQIQFHLQIKKFLNADRICAPHRRGDRIVEVHVHRGEQLSRRAAKADALQERLKENGYTLRHRQRAPDQLEKR
jgi:hypothetical protein